MISLKKPKRFYKEIKADVWAVNSDGSMEFESRWPDRESARKHCRQLNARAQYGACRWPRSQS